MALKGKTKAHATRATGPAGAIGTGRGELGFRAKFQLTLGDGTLFGDGKAELLALTEELGSLRRASERMGMSYRYAWGLLRELDRAAGFAFLEHRGQGRRSAFRLTAEGRAFLASWRRFREPLDGLVGNRFARVFGAR